MSAWREWAHVVAVTAYDIVLEPTVRRVRRGWELGKAAAEADR